MIRQSICHNITKSIGTEITSHSLIAFKYYVFMMSGWSCPVMYLPHRSLESVALVGDLPSEELEVIEVQRAGLVKVNRIGGLAM